MNYPWRVIANKRIRSHILKISMIWRMIKTENKNQVMSKDQIDDFRQTKVATCMVYPGSHHLSLQQFQMLRLDSEVKPKAEGSGGERVSLSIVALLED